MNQLTQSIDNLACEFFKEFARFEYALKAAGYYEFNNRRDYLVVKWADFAKTQTVVSYFSKQHFGDLGNAISYLCQNPPKKQVDELRWKDCEKSGELSEQLCEYIRRVRNNLFHGGKSNEDWINRNRSKQLIHHSLTVLRAFLDASTEVAKAYSESICTRQFVNEK